VTLAECAAAAARDLAAAGQTPEDSRRDAAHLSRHLLGWAVDAWLVHRNDPAPAGFQLRLGALVARRAAHEPIAYITGTREFYGRPFAVTPAVLIPRPETELLVDAALTALGPACASAVRPLHVADIGTGSGCLAVTLAVECPAAHVIATDLSERALAVARTNATSLGALDRVEFRHGTLLAGPCGALDLIVSNPPYVPDADRDGLPAEVRDYEPSGALFAGQDGLDVIREILRLAAPSLRPGGTLLVEIGAGQAAAVRGLVAAAPGLAFVEFQPDLQGIPRVLVCRRAPIA
jgi:release factor glutamine methyltransferase